MNSITKGSETVVLGGGCFWCTEAVYQQLKGIKLVTPGYAGGDLPNPTYEQVSSGTTGHAEVVRVEFEPQQLSFADILDVFWATHDPTTFNRQGADIGSQYRSVIFYDGLEQKRAAVASKHRLDQSRIYPSPVVTEIVPLNKFWPAESEHKDYFKNHPEQAYCQVVINPKLTKLRQKFADKLK